MKNCKYFEIHGQCRYGDKCKHHHANSPGKKTKKGKGADKGKETEKTKEKGYKGAEKGGDAKE
eukprot:9023622-Lingulodinium_polyedra.AAC.1